MSNAVNYGGFNSYDSSLPYDVPDVSTGVDSLSPNPSIQLNYSDVATPTALIRQIGMTDQVLLVQNTEGYPSAPFLISIDTATISQEVILVQGTTSASFFDCVRNFDGMGAFPHEVYAPIIHSLTSQDYATLNHHIFSPTEDWHPQYLDEFRHENPSLHQLGTSIPYGIPLNSSPGDIDSPGTSTVAVPSDHVHGRESLQQILYEGAPVDTCVFMNTYRTDTFFWLQTPSSATVAPNPLSGWVPQGNAIPFSDYIPLSPGSAMIENHVWGYTLIMDPHVSILKR